MRKIFKVPVLLTISQVAAYWGVSERSARNMVSQRVIISPQLIRYPASTIPDYESAWRITDKPFTPKEAAEHLHCSTKTIYRLMSSGKLGYTKPTTRHALVDMDSFIKLIKGTHRK